MYFFPARGIFKKIIRMQPHPNREELHFLLDRIPDSDMATARKILRALADPVELALRNAPPDIEPLSAHE